MNCHGFGMYLFIGVFVLFISTALSQKTPNTSQNAPANSPVTPAKFPRKGIRAFHAYPSSVSHTNTLPEVNHEGVTDVPEEREIGEDPTTSVDGLTQRTESNYGTDPIEQRDATTPMPKQPMVWKQHGPAAPAAKPVARAPTVPQKVSNQMAKPPTFARGSARIAPHARKPIIPRDPIVHARPVAQKTKHVPREPIVHARRTTPEPKEVEVEGTTSYYYDYYNGYNNHYDGKNGSGINQSGSPGDTTCPVFTETIMEHHVILRRKGCEIVLSQDDAIRWFGRPTRPLVYSRKYL